MPSPHSGASGWQLLSQKPAVGGSQSSVVPGSTVPLPQKTVLAQLILNVWVTGQLALSGFFTAWLSVTVTVSVCRPTVVQLLLRRRQPPRSTNEPAVAVHAYGQQSRPRPRPSPRADTST